METEMQTAASEGPCPEANYTGVMYDQYVYYHCLHCTAGMGHKASWSLTH